MIKIRNIRKTFGENTILRGIDLDVGKGQVVVILGPSGSGKTTFLRCLNALEMPEDGQIEFDNERPLKIDFLKNRRSTTFWHCAANPAWCSNNTTSFRIKPTLENVMEGPIAVQGQACCTSARRSFEIAGKSRLGRPG